MPTPNFVKEIRVAADGQALVLTSLVDQGGTAVPAYSTNTAGVLTNQVTFPTVISADTSLWCDAQAVGQYAILAGETTGGVPLTGGYATDAGFRVTNWGTPGSSTFSPGSNTSAAGRYAGSDFQTTNESYDFNLGNSANITVATTGISNAVPVFMRQGKKVNSATFFTATTAAITPTHWGVAIYSTAAVPALLGQTADQLTAALAANTKIVVPFTTTFVIPSTGFYWVSTWFVCGTQPTVYGVTAANAALAAGFSNRPLWSQTHGSGIVGTAPATITGAATVTTKMYVRVD